MNPQMARSEELQWEWEARGEGQEKRTKNTFCLQHLVGERKYFLLRKPRQFFIAKTQFFQYQKGYTTCNLLPLDRNVCLLSSARSWPSFCQVILGEGLPLGMQSMAASLLTSTVTSSGRSPSAPLMDGGAAGSKGQKNTHSAPLKWLWERLGLQEEGVKPPVNDKAMPRVVQLEQLSATPRGTTEPQHLSTAHREER